jgi:hypothetical protein
MRQILTDSRGRAVSLLPLEQQRAGWPAGDARLQFLSRRLLIARRSPRVPAWVPAIPVGGLVMSNVVTWAGSPRLGLALLFVTLGCGVAFLLFHEVRWRAHRTQAIVRTLLEEGLCPVCGYNFMGLAETQSGELVCPECGSIWRSTLIRRMDSFAPRVPGGGEAPVLVYGAYRSGRDDRRRDVPGLSYALLPALRRETGVDVRWRLVDARRTLLKRGRVLRWLTGIVVAGICFTPLRWAWQVLPPTIVIFLGLLCLLLGVLLGAGSLARGGHRSVRRELLARDLCPGCGASLSGGCVGGDGIAECPVCWSAWRITPPREGSAIPGMSAERHGQAQSGLPMPPR